MKRIIQLGAIVAAFVAVGTAAWSAGDYLRIRPVLKSEFELVMNQVQQNTQAVLRITFDNLTRKREYGGLTFDEQQNLCRIAAALEYVGVPGCQ